MEPKSKRRSSHVARQHNRDGGASKRRALTSREVMEALGINRTTFDMLRETDDHFITFRVGRNLRMDVADLEAWLERQKKREQAAHGKDLQAVA